MIAGGVRNEVVGVVAATEVSDCSIFCHSCLGVGSDGNDEIVGILGFEKDVMLIKGEERRSCRNISNNFQSLD